MPKLVKEQRTNVQRTINFSLGVVAAKRAKEALMSFYVEPIHENTLEKQTSLSVSIYWDFDFKL